MRFSHRAGFTVAAGLLAAVSVFGQGGTASLSGRVVDPTGAVVPGSRIDAQNVATNVSYKAESNDAGLYNLPNIPPGMYQISASAQGFKTLVRKNVELHVADITSVDFTLELGGETQSVTVEAGSQVVNTDTSSMGGLVESREIQNLPLNGRNYIDLTLMQPGVSANPNTNKSGSYTGVWFATNGASIRSNNFTIDGAIMQDVNSGSTADFAGRTLGLDGIQEYRVLTGVFSAEYGMTMGSQSVMVSKSGGNKFHGDVFEYLRNSAMDARNFFDIPVAANNFERLPPYHRSNFGVSLGGPIQKDRTFFFATFEGVRESLGTTNIDNVLAAGCHGAAGDTVWNGTGVQPAGSIGPCTQLGANPSGAGTNTVKIQSAVAPILALYPLPNLPANQVTIPYNQPDSDYFGQIRIDHMFSPSDNMFARYTINDDASATGQTFPNYFILFKLTRHQYATLSETHVFSNEVVNTARFSFSRTASDRTSPSTYTGPEYSFVPGLYIGLTQVGGLTQFGPAAAAPNVQTQNIGSLTEDLSYFHGGHSLKFGTLVNTYRQYGLNSSGAYGNINFSSVANFLQGVLNTSSAISRGSLLDRTYQFYTVGLYAQDDWHVTRTFVLNYGLRWEFSPNYYSEVHGISNAYINPYTQGALTPGPFFKNPTWGNVSPRLGFAWNITGDGKTALRGGAAIMYDIANLGNYVLNFNLAQPPYSNKSQVSGGTLSLPLTFPASAAGKTINVAQYDFKNAKIYTEQLTLERQLASNFVLSVSYVGTRGLHVVSTRELDPNIPTVQPDGTLFWPATTTHVNPNWTSVQAMSSNSDSSYNALQVGLLKRLSKSLQFQSTYTYGKALDNAQGATGDNTSSSSFPADPFNNRYDRGLSSFNLKHTFVTNLVYSLPSPHLDNKFLAGVTGGWVLSGIFTRHSGLPFTPLETTERSRSGVAAGSNSNSNGIDRPNWNPAFTGPVITGSPNQYYNPNAFILQPAGTLGNVSRNSLIGPGLVELDFSVEKAAKLPFLGEGGALQFRAEFFNIINHPNLGMPNDGVFSGTTSDVTEVPLSTAGVITNTIGTSRQVELSLKIIW